MRLKQHWKENTMNGQICREQNIRLRKKTEWKFINGKRERQKGLNIGVKRKPMSYLKRR